MRSRSGSSPPGFGLEWGVANRPLPGEAESGDRHVARGFGQGVLLAAIDGLGHGSEAAAAARQAAAFLEQNAEDSVISLVRRCHQELTETRGAAMSLASFLASEGTLTWLGVGNVQGLVLRADPRATPSRESLLLRGGVVGYQLPQLSAAVVCVAPGDVLVLATDGIRSDFDERLLPGGAPQQMADRILSESGRGNDDALVLVAQFSGAGG